jgi:hypothetical protein
MPLVLIWSICRGRRAPISPLQKRHKVPLKLIDTVDDRAAGGDHSGRLALPARCLPRSLRREEIEGSCPG